MAKIIIDVCWKDKKFVEEIVKENYEPGSMLDTEIRMGLKEAVVVSSEQDIIKPYLEKLKADVEAAYNELDGYDPDALGTFANRVDDLIDNMLSGSEGK